MRETAAWPMLLLVTCLLTALACNAPLEPEPTIAPPASVTVTPTPPITRTAAPETIPAGSPIPGTTPTPRPTFTPIQEPTAASTFTPAPPTATPVKTSTPSSTATAASSGPLSFSYQIAWSLDPQEPYTAIASVTITASGGDGEYQYFRDEIEVDGPQFTYRWAACRPNPGSFRVTSGDGQSVKQDYFSVPPCPTPTPTATP